MKKYKILVVENDEDEQFFIEEAFEATGLFDILKTVKNGDVLFEWLGENDELPDLILSDLNMPGKNGYEIISEIRAIAKYAHLPIVIMSTSSAQWSKDKCMDAGANWYMMKPETFLEYNVFADALYRLLCENKWVNLGENENSYP